MDIPTTTFQTRYGHYECLVISFGLTKAPTAYMNMMNGAFRSFLDLFVFFIDEIMVCCRSEEEHKVHFHTIFGLLKRKKLYAKYSSVTSIFLQYPYWGIWFIRALWGWTRFI